jgi:hypothetical protein
MPLYRNSEHSFAKNAPLYPLGFASVFIPRPIFSSTSSGCFFAACAFECINVATKQKQKNKENSFFQKNKIDRDRCPSCTVHERCWSSLFFVMNFVVIARNSLIQGTMDPRLKRCRACGACSEKMDKCPTCKSQYQIKWSAFLALRCLNSPMLHANSKYGSIQ